MAKFSFFLFAMALIASLQAYEAHRVGKFHGALEKHTMIEEQLKAKKMSIQGLTTEVKTLSKSEEMLTHLGNDYKKDMDLAPYEKKLRKFSRTLNLRKAPVAKNNKKPVSIIQTILKDFGLNGGRN